MNNAGIRHQAFEGQGAHEDNSSIRYLEFNKIDAIVEFTNFSPGEDPDPEKVCVPPKFIVEMMMRLAEEAKRLLASLRGDQVEMAVCRAFMNVMEGPGMGAVAHKDLDAPLGTVVLKVSELEAPEEALQIFASSDGGVATPCPLGTGVAIAFLPNTLHAVPTVVRENPRVTVNFFFTKA
jgi:hypothetical protein